jgi:nitrite reductase/ring-hydroxylating ferredoxin subunit
MFEGYIDTLDEELYITCPVHGFQFRLKTGEQPHNMGCRLPVYEHKTENGYIYVRRPEVKKFDFDF